MRAASDVGASTRARAGVRTSCIEVRHSLRARRSQRRGLGVYEPLMILDGHRETDRGGR